MSAARVAIIGGGAVGLFCAWRLAGRGASVTLIEPRSLVVEDPSAASWAAAGMLGAVSEALGEPDAADWLALGARGLEAWARASRDLAPVEALSSFGSLLLGDGPARIAALVRLETEARAAGFVVRTASRADLLARGIGAAAHVEIALEAPFERLVAIAATVRGLADRIDAAGVRLSLGRVRAVEAAGAGLAVHLANGDLVRCDVVVAAPGYGEAGAAIEGLPALAALSPAKGQMAMLAAALPAVVRAEGVYLAPRREGLVLGATMERGRADREVDAAAIRALQAAAARAIPALAGAPLVRAWAGVRPMSPDGRPLVGPSGPPGALVAAGHSRNGWLLAPLTAEIIADMALTGAAAPPDLDPARFDSKRLQQGPPA